MSVFLEKVGTKYYGDIADSDLGIKIHKEYVIDSDSDISSVPTDCAPGSFAATTDLSKIYRLKNDYTWELYQEDSDPSESTAKVKEAVIEWVQNHVEELGTVVVDDTLSIAGAAADAKMVGEYVAAKSDATENTKLAYDTDTTEYSIAEMSDLEEIRLDLSQEVSRAEDAESELEEDLKQSMLANPITDGWTANCVIATNGSTVDVTATTAKTGYRCIAVSCSENDIFVINAKSQTSSGAVWCFVDSDGNKLSIRNPVYGTDTQKIISAPNDAAYLVINDNLLTGKCYKADATTVSSVVLVNYLDDINGNFAETDAEIYLSNRATVDGYSSCVYSEYEIGSIDSSGAKYSDNTYIRTADYVTFDSSGGLDIIKPYGSKIYAVRYNLDGTISTRDHVTDNAERVRYNVFANYKYKFLYRTSSGETITADTLKSVSYQFKLYVESSTLNDIIRKNNDKSGAIIQLSRSRASQFTNPYTPLVFVHFSDVHSQKTEWNNICDFLDYWQDTISFAVHTGDMAGTYQGDYVNLYALRKPNKVKILNILGNHDTYSQYTPTTVATQEETFSTIFNDDTEYTSWGCTFGDGDNIMYWYKDFTEQGIRLVAIDPYYWDSTEADWLDTVLAGAKDSGLSVITLAHERGSEVTSVGSSFYTKDPFDRPLTVTAFYQHIVDFVSNGGEHIVHLSGHFHHDKFGLTSDNILVSQVECATHNNDATDTVRGGSLFLTTEKTFDCFNVMQIDRNTGLLKIVRIGCNVDDHLQSKNMLCYDYVNKQLISNS